MTMDCLLNVEQEGEEIIKNAQLQAEQKIAVTKKQLEDEYKIKLEALAAKVEEAFQKGCRAIDERYEKLFEDYKSSLMTKKQDKKNFNNLVSDCLSKG